MYFGCAVYQKDEVTLKWQIQTPRGLGTCQMTDEDTWIWLEMKHLWSPCMTYNESLFNELFQLASQLPFLINWIRRLQL